MGLTRKAAAPSFGLGIGRKRDPNGQIANHLVAKNTSMTYLALTLVPETHQPVVDRTGIPGNFEIPVEALIIDHAEKPDAN